MDERMIPLRHLRAYLDLALHEATMCGHCETYEFERSAVRYIEEVAQRILAKIAAFEARHEPCPAAPEGDDPADYCARPTKLLCCFSRGG